MKKILYLSFLLSFQFVYAQSDFVDVYTFFKKVVEKTGWDKWSQKNNIRLEYTYSNPDTTEKIKVSYMTKLFIYKFPNDYYLDMCSKNSFMSSRIIELGLDGKYYLSDDSSKLRFAHKNDPYNFPHFSHELVTLYLFDRCPQCADMYHVSTQVENGKKMYVVTADIGKEYRALTYYDADTFLKIREETTLDEKKLVIYFDDWRNVEGFWIPFKQSLGTGWDVLQSVHFDTDVSTYFVTPNPQTPKQ